MDKHFPTIGWMMAAFCLAGCAASQEDLAWRVAKDSNSPSDYANYMRQYPSGEHAKEARWEAARRADTVSAYLAYLKEDPQSPHAKEIQDRITTAAEKDLSVSDAYSYLAYVRTEGKPPSKKTLARLDSVRRHLEEREWTQAKESGKLLPLVFFLRKYPASAHAAEAQELVQKSRFESVKRMSQPFAYRAFLSFYGQGTQADEIRGLLEKADEPALSAESDAALDRDGVVGRLAEKDASIGRLACSLILSDQIRKSAQPSLADESREKLAALEAEGPLPPECSGLKGVTLNWKDKGPAARAVTLFLHGQKNLSELAEKYKAMAQRAELSERSVKAADTLAKQLESDELSEGVLGGGALGGVDLGLSEKGSATADRAKERLDILAAAAARNVHQAEAMVRGQGGKSEAVRFYLISLLKLESSGESR